LSEFLTAALSYAAKGWHVFPIQPRGKLPLIPKSKGGQAHKDATTDPEKIKAWWAACPDANIGLSLEPSGLVVLDVDTGSGKGGFEALTTLHGAFPLPDTLTAHTGGGGLHAVYARPEGCPANRLIDFLHLLVPEAGKASGLDLLGKGYIVAAPSVHQSGKRYKWAAEAPTQPLPVALVGAYSAKAEPVARPVSDGEIVVAEGGRDNALFRLGCTLRETGLSEESLHAALYGENLKRAGAQIPGVSRGAPTQRYLTRVLRRITFPGALFLGVIAVLPFLVTVAIPDLRNVTTSGGSFLINSSGLLIVVGVVRDTFFNIEAELKIHGYDESLLVR